VIAFLDASALIYLLEGRQPWADAVKKAQWEYACLAGTSTPVHFVRTITPELANYDGNDAYGDGPKREYRQQTTPWGASRPMPGACRTCTGREANPAALDPAQRRRLGAVREELVDDALPAAARMV